MQDRSFAFRRDPGLHFLPGAHVGGSELDGADFALPSQDQA